MLRNFNIDHLRALGGLKCFASLGVTAVQPVKGQHGTQNSINYGKLSKAASRTVEIGSI